MQNNDDEGKDDLQSIDLGPVIELSILAADNGVIGL